jgi:DNA polymerase-3 subunit delta'
MYDFDDVIGNERIVKSLRTAIANDRVNHAYIFEGSRGSGRRTIANAFAKTLNCETGDNKACDECVSCATFDSGNNPDVIYVCLKAGERELKVDAVRNEINKNVELKPYSNRYKIFIIEDADTMNIAAQNAFLKTLEEPPAYAVFLLLAENCSKFLVTVMSRCQHFRLQSLPAGKIADYVAKRSGIDSEQAYVAALYSRGSIGRAMELADSEEFNSLRGEVAERTVRLLETDLIGMYALAGEMDGYKDRIYEYLDIMYLIYRDSLVYKSTGSTERLIQRDSVRLIERIASLTNTKRLIKGCELIDGAIDNLRRHGDFQLTVENLFFKLKEK